MTDSHLDDNKSHGEDYRVGQDLYAASVEDMRAWAEALRREIIRLDAEIEKKQRERAAADSIFKKPD
jgi:uncharacterized small protein (DUF1192 family)